MAKIIEYMLTLRHLNPIPLCGSFYKHVEEIFESPAA
jgi:hypothetical protein